jgi:hypothetical protein
MGFIWLCCTHIITHIAFVRLSIAAKQHAYCKAADEVQAIDIAAKQANHPLQLHSEHYCTASAQKQYSPYHELLGHSFGVAVT